MNLPGGIALDPDLLVSGLWLAFDLILIAAILCVAGGALLARDGFQMIVLFIVFGLLVALAWIRLRAPDVALAEAAIGSGLTGALLLKTWSRLDAERRDAVARSDAAAAALRRFVIVPPLGLLILGLGLAVLNAPSGATVSADSVAHNMGRSGASNPVTAVLLNFRAYDTLLEIVVLLAAVACVWSLRPTAEPARGPELGIIFVGFARLFLPAMVLLAGYLLWLGAFAPGGAFQGAAMLAAVGILLVLGKRYQLTQADESRARLLFVTGTAAFVVAAMAGIALGGEFLQLPEAAAKQWILAIEAALTISIAATLAGLFYGRAPTVPTPADRPR